MSHWYEIATGAPRHKVLAKSGELRDTTLRDARTLGLVPSVTTVIKEASAPALTNWMVDQALLSALTLPRAGDESLDAFMKRAKEDSKKQAQAAAERGTEIHDAIEAHFLGRYVSDRDRPFVDGVIAAIEREFGLDGWIPEQSFAHASGYGGKVDLHRPGIVLDYKGKDFKPGEDKAPAYDEHAMQLSAYAVGLGMPNALRVNVFFDRQVPGKVIVHRWPEGGDWFERFLCLLEYWKRRNKYWPCQTVTERAA